MIKKISNILSCLFILCGVQSAYAEENTVLMNKEILWNGNALISAIDKAYQPGIDEAWDEYTDALMSYSNPESVEVEFKKSAYDGFVADRKALIEWSLKQERFSLQQILETCMSASFLYTPATVCRNLLKSLIDIAGGKLEGYIKEPAEEEKSQRCVNHNLTFSGNQTKYDDEFIYPSNYLFTQEPPNGYECDPGGAEEACDEGDEVYVPYGYFKNREIPRNTTTFRCVRDAFGDRWEAVTNNPDLAPRDHM